MGYLGDRYKLSGTSMDQKRLNVQALNEAYDLRNEVIEHVYPFKDKCRDDPEFKNKFEKHLSEGYKAKYGKLEAWFVANGGPYSCGKSVVAADFHIWELLDQHEVYAKAMGKASPLKEYPALSRLYEVFKNLPQLQKYFKSDAYKLQCNFPGLSYTSKLYNV